MKMNGVVFWVFAVLSLTPGQDVSGGSIPQPTNPSLSCRNFETFLYWNYSDTSLKPTFTVIVARYTSDIQNIVENIPHHYCNVSSFINDIEEHYYLTIKAVAGLENSTIDLPKFSLKDTCVLDFPKVNLTATGRALKILFKHPFFFYKKKNQFLKREPSIDYEYMVEYKKKNELNQSSTIRFTCETRECERYFKVPNDEDYCLSFSGRMSGIQVISRDEICTENHPKQNSLGKKIIIIITVIVCGIVLVLLSLILIVYNIMRKKNIPLPSSLASMLTGIKPYMNIKKEDSTFSVVKHAETPNQLEEEENGMTEQIKNDGPEHEPPRLKIGLKNIERVNNIIQPEVSDLVLEVSLSDQTDVKENTELLTNKMDKSDNNNSPRPISINGYDRPHILVEMSTGDTVEGYRHTQLD
ncbi:interferon gamma receptor 1-like [Acipenser oxyrinchus oxyrinchus]|uniref:Interferon gamma receptor 1-like n=1 Tax=Acipenser oxyrinchus oxyrinchus TaxID=40147 RepID=A0AAD8GBN3_ACIOX|nr:interferon gamma receptor 1-like [Acipenser oxyrinchus oxyrinchus]